MKIRLLSRLKKPILTKFRKPPESLLFLIILLKIIFLYREEKKNEKNKNDLNFWIVDERDKNIKRFDIKRFMNVNRRYSLSKREIVNMKDKKIKRFMSVNCRRFFPWKIELFTFKIMISIKFTNSNIKSLLNNFSKENEKVSSLILWVIIFINEIIKEI